MHQRKYSNLPVFQVQEMWTCKAFFFFFFLFFFFFNEKKNPTQGQRQIQPNELQQEFSSLTLNGAVTHRTLILIIASRAAET